MLTGQNSGDIILNSPVMFHRSLWGKRETVETCLHFNPVEFDGFKNRIIELLPDTKGEKARLPHLFKVPQHGCRQHRGDAKRKQGNDSSGRLIQAFLPVSRPAFLVHGCQDV